MKAQLRLRFVVPLLLIAVAGLAVFQLGLLDRLTGSDEEASATPPAVQPASPTTDAPAEEPTEPAPTTTADESPAATDAQASTSSKPTGLEQLQKALGKNKVVVLVVYSPDGSLDTLQIAEARQGAEDAGAGFVAVNGSKEKQVAELAQAYDIRITPSVLVFVRGPELAARFDDYADATTVAQAAQSARQSTS